MEPVSESSGAHRVLVGGSQASERWVPFVEELLSRAVDLLAERAIVPARSELSVMLVDDAEIHALNRQYRGVDRPTDVLSFSQLEGPGLDLTALEPLYHLPLGDIVVSIPRMRAQAVEYGHSEERELGFLLVHGLLHLLGFDHEAPDEALAMRATAEDVLAAAGLTRGSATA